MEKKFSELIFEFLNMRFGALLARQYIDMARFKLHISNLDSAGEHEIILFIDFIASKLFSKFPQDVQKRKKSVLYYQIFGTNMHLPFQPVSYLHYNFGDNFGDEVAGVSQVSFKIGDILKRDEKYQEEFVSKILKNMFEPYGDASNDLIQNEFQNFVTSPDHTALDSFKCIMPDSGYDLDSSFEVFKSMTDYMNEHSNDSFPGMRVGDMKSCLSKMEIPSSEQDFYVQSIQKRLNFTSGSSALSSSSNTDHISFVNDIKKIVGEFVGAESAGSLIKECLDNIGIKDISAEDESKKQLFLNYMISNTIISNFSEQKKNLVKSKIHDVLGL